MTASVKLGRSKAGSQKLLGLPCEGSVPTLEPSFDAFPGHSWKGAGSEVDRLKLEMLIMGDVGTVSGGSLTYRGTSFHP